MFDKFCDYMYYLLTSPFKKVKKSLNQWYILFKVLGRRFDDAMESLYRAGEQTMVATCDPEMLLEHAKDRGMKRYDGEEMENFRARIAMYREVCRLGGTRQGVVMAVRAIGYGDAAIKTAKELKGTDERWAEFYVLIRIQVGQGFPIPFHILQKEVRTWKDVGAKDNYQFTIENTDRTNETYGTFRAVPRLSVCVPEETGTSIVCRMGIENELNPGLTINIKNDLWYWNGEHRLDGKQLLDAYERTEEMS